MESRIPECVLPEVPSPADSEEIHSKNTVPNTMCEFEKVKRSSLSQY